jgi:tRNA threonylcarbamoyladenosine biosynthesis protein TsaB
MRILALDTTTRGGSLALINRDELVGAESGDPTRTHGERLPGEILRFLTTHHVSLADVDIFAVAAGPGSFTGLRVGIATMQGLSAANRKGLIGVSALDALAFGARRQMLQSERDPAEGLAVWMDAHRGEVFAALYDGTSLSRLDGPLVASPEAVLRRWASVIPEAGFVGDGAIVYRQLITPNLILEPTPLVAPAVAWIAADSARTGPVPGPEAIRPLYVRRPDAELARARHKVHSDQ